jgi:hypothetical protein
VADLEMPGSRPSDLSAVPSVTVGPEPVPPISCSWADVFGSTSGASDPYLEITNWDAAIQVFVGRNGSGKTQAARALLRRVKGLVSTHYLSADRLFGLSTAGHHGGNLMGPSGEFAGVTLSEEARQAAGRLGDQYGLAAEDLFALHESPQARIRMAAAVRDALGRTVDLSSRSGLIDPVVTFESLS